MRQIEPGAHMVGVARQHLPEPVGGALELALEQERGAEAVQGAHVARRVGERARKRDLGVRRIGAADVDAAELDRELGHGRRDRQPALERNLGVVVAAHRAVEEAELVERRRERRLPGGRALEPFQRLGLAADVTQRQRKVGFDDRVGAVARRQFERRHRLARALLCQQSQAQEMQGARMLRPAARAHSRAMRSASSGR